MLAAERRRRRRRGAASRALVAGARRGDSTADRAASSAACRIGCSRRGSARHRGCVRADAGSTVAGAAVSARRGARDRFVTTGVGSSAAHAQLLAHLLAVVAGLPARFVARRRVRRAGAPTPRDALIVFSQGLSPNARLALARLRRRGSASSGHGGHGATAATPAKRAALARRPRRRRRRIVPLPGGTEYGALLRVAGPLAGYAIAYRLAAAIAAAAGLSTTARLRVDAAADRRGRCVPPAPPPRACRAIPRRPLAFLASGGYGELGEQPGAQGRTRALRSRRRRSGI